MALVALLAIIAEIMVVINVGMLNASQGAAARNAAFLCSSMVMVSLCAQYIQNTIEDIAEQKKRIGSTGNEYSSCMLSIMTPPLIKPSIKMKATFAANKCTGFCSITNFLG